MGEVGELGQEEGAGPWGEVQEEVGGLSGEILSWGVSPQYQTVI